jgi:hypothetical protein
MVKLPLIVVAVVDVDYVQMDIHVLIAVIVLIMHAIHFHYALLNT